MRRPSVWGECLSEYVGTFILVFFGVGSVNAAVLAGVTAGLWQVAAVWGAGVALAIYATGAISGAHINPAITIALAAWRGFPKAKVAPYLAAQLAGAFCGSLLLYGLFHGLLVHFEAGHHLIRGGPGSELSAMVFGEYFPNPAMFGASQDADQRVSLATAMLAEGIGSAFLACFVFALTEPRNPLASRPVAPLFIGLGLAIIISIIAPLTQAGLNPARDFGPRLASYLLGWGRVAIPGPRGGFFTVYVLSPILGAVLGSGLYQALRRQLGSAPAVEAEESAMEAEPAEASVMSQPESSFVLVPCEDSGHLGCAIARRAAELVAVATPEAALRAAGECPRGARAFVVAVDGSSSCQASAHLEQCGVRPSAVVSAPAVLARAGLVRPGVDLRARSEELAQALAAAISDSLQSVLTELRERRRYQQEMAPIMERFRGMWSKVELLPSPGGVPPEAERSRVELLARRSRNLFVKFDEIVPPAEWAEPHDLFQDALLCVAYACEGWVAGDAPRWDQNLEKARLQLKPLLRRLE